jgi:hypothetical protein
MGSAIFWRFLADQASAAIHLLRHARNILPVLGCLTPVWQRLSSQLFYSEIGLWLWLKLDFYCSFVTLDLCTDPSGQDDGASIPPVLGR